ncbi:lipoprotein [Spirochaetia bacterium]|nr:lipoprotein [Spirochaetia bacterium]
MRKLFGFLLVFLAFSGCSRGRISSVARMDLFNLEIGPLEDQVSLFNQPGDSSSRRTSLAMRDGLFYISDTSGGKIVRYSSYGDLLFVIYNEETSPPPIALGRGIDEEGMVTRWSVTYPLREPGAITVDSRKHIYTADRAGDERRINDAEDGALLDNVVLHFDDTGRFVNFLGQEGIGGKPFPRITGIYASQNDEIAVVCQLSAGWNIYWYNAEGTLLFLVHLRNDSIPQPSGSPADYSSMDTVTAAPDERKLFFKVDYYRNTVDENNNSMASPDSSVIWIMNIENGSYEESINVPFFEYTAVENDKKVTQKLPYAMLGVIRNSRVFLYFPVDGGYSLLVLTAGSKEQRLGFIQVRNDELEYNTFNLSAEGILSGLLATEWDARLVWWRTDRLLGEMNL